MIKRTSALLFMILAWQTILFAQASLQTRLDALLKEDFLKTSEVGIAVYDLTAGKPVYSYQDKKLYRPASVEKLITAITGLSVLGADHRFETSLFHTGEINGDELNGDLYVVGGFDPEFADAGMDSLVNIIEKTGIRTINGSLYGDVSMTDSLYWGPGWSWDDTPYYFQPYLSPLMFCKGYVEVTAHPLQKDSLARLVCIPASSYYTLTNQTKSRNTNAGKFEVSRNWLENGNHIFVKGGVSSVRKDRVNMYTSRDFFMHTFRERLLKRSITVPDYCFSECPSDSTALQLGVYSHSFPTVLDRAMKKSDNLSAEAIFYHLAAKYSGSKRAGNADGVNSIHAMIRKLQLDPKDYQIADGSGVSLYNYISPELLLAFLKYAYANKAIYTSLYKALPIAGVDGTLRGRMKEGKAYNNVRAKTGSVTGVSSLAGYAKAANGNLLAFVIINQNVMKQEKARMFQNRLCEVLCN